MNQPAPMTTVASESVASPLKPMAAGRGDILVVDDILSNLELLVDLLKKEGYRVRPTSSGTAALRAAEAKVPDLVLLDIDMPDMTGYEVCRRLKATPSLRHVPVVFLSAFDGAEDKVKAFASGGVDYITKPFQIEEVTHRVATHLRLEQLQIRLEEQNYELQRRNRELERMRSLQNNLGNMIIHDLRSPLAGVMGYLELLQISAGPNLDDAQIEDLCKASDACNNAVELVNSLLDISRLESSRMPLRPVNMDLSQVAGRAAQLLETQCGQRTVEINSPGTPVRVRADVHITQRVITNLFQNAISATANDGRISLHVSEENGWACFSIRDNGRGIPEAYLPRLFNKFEQADIRREDRTARFGIGLAFCKLAIEAQEGQIGVESKPNLGSQFWFKLPQGQSSTQISTQTS